MLKDDIEDNSADRSCGYTLRTTFWITLRKILFICPADRSWGYALRTDPEDDIEDNSADRSCGYTLQMTLQICPADTSCWYALWTDLEDMPCGQILRICLADNTADRSYGYTLRTTLRITQRTTLRICPADSSWGYALRTEPENDIEFNLADMPCGQILQMIHEWLAGNYLTDQWLILPTLECQRYQTTSSRIFFK